jgi:DNA-binding LytR/AlgR family response regulator
MPEMNVLIIEDEKPASRRLVRLLGQAEPGAVILDVIPSVEKAVNWLAERMATGQVPSGKMIPELIFMDIQLEDGICFEIFEQCDVRTPVVFTTAFDEYMLKAFKVNSVDYLLKPVSVEDLKQAFAKFRRFHSSDSQTPAIESLINHFMPKTKERFLVKIGEHYKSVPTQNITCFYIRERCNFLLTDEGKSYPVDHSLDKIEELVDPKQFTRISRNAIISFNAIKDVVGYSTSRLKIILRGWTDDEDLLVSRERVAAFKEWMDR